METLLDKTSKFILRNYRIIIVIYIVLILICIAGLFRITLRTELLDVLPDIKGVKEFKEIMNDIRANNSLIIQVKTTSGDILEHTALIEDIARSLKTSPVVRAVRYNRFVQSGGFFVRHFPLYLDVEGIKKIKQKLSKEGIKAEIKKDYSLIVSPFSSPLKSLMVEKDPLNIAEIFINRMKKDEALKRLDLTTGYYLSKDHHSALIFVTPQFKAGLIKDLKQLQKEIKTCIKSVLKDKNTKDISIGFLGPVALSWEVYSKLSGDLIKSLGITLMVIFIVFLIIFQWNLIIPVIFLLLLSTVFLTLNTAQVLFEGVNIVTALVSAIIVGLGIDYHIHIFDRFNAELSKYHEDKIALSRTLITTGRSVLTGGLTTIVAFLSILVTEFKGLHQLGIIAASGIAYSIITALVVLPSIMLFVEKRGHLNRRQKSISFDARIPGLFVRYAPWLGIITIVLIVIATPGIMRLRFDSGLQGIGLSNSRVLKEQSRMLGSLFYTIQPLIVFTNVKSLDEDFNHLERVLESLMKKGLIGRYNSLSEILPPLYKQLMVIESLKGFNLDDIEKTFTDTLKKYNFRVTDEMKNYIREVIHALKLTSPVSLHDLPKELKTQARYFYNPEEKRLLAFIYPSGDRWSSEALNELKKTMDNTEGRIKLTGWPIVSKKLKSLIIRQSIVATLITFVFCIVLTWLHFRHWRIVFLCLLSPVIGFYLTCAIVGIADISFNYINIASAALLFGISIDYAVYLLQAFHEKDADALVVHTLKDILICAISTVVGFLTLTLTSFKGIATLGEIVSIGIVSSVLSLSLLILLFYRSRRYGDGRV